MQRLTVDVTHENMHRRACNLEKWLVDWYQSPNIQAWQNDYLRGTGMEMYTETLSPTFIGMPFAKATE